MATIRKNQEAFELLYLLQRWGVAGPFAEKHLFPQLEVVPQSPQARRVEQLLELLSRVGRGEWAAREWAAFLNKRDVLSRYKWHYGLTYSSKGLRADLVYPEGLSEEDAWEYRAVRFLMGLVPDRIDRLRRCKFEGCKKWFFAEQRWDQEFCKRSNCRQNHYDSDEEHKKKKRALMVQNRKWHQEQNRKRRPPKKKTAGRGRAKGTR